RRADVAAAGDTDVDPGAPREQERERDGAHGVAEEDRADHHPSEYITPSGRGQRQRQRAGSEGRGPRARAEGGGQRAEGREQGQRAEGLGIGPGDRAWG